MMLMPPPAFIFAAAFALSSLLRFRRLMLPAFAGAY